MSIDLNNQISYDRRSLERYHVIVCVSPVHAVLNANDRYGQEPFILKFWKKFKYVIG